MTKTTETTRRSFLKSGALVAVPVAAIGLPAAALAEDGSKAALARLQDERAIEALAHDFVRMFNRGGAHGTASLFANRASPAIGKGISKLNLDLSETPQSVTIAGDGASATARYACTVDIAHDLEGQATIVQMARLQGGAAVTHSARKTLAAHFARAEDGWRIAGVELG
jgi:hypothetical protein